MFESAQHFKTPDKKSLPDHKFNNSIANVEKPFLSHFTTTVKKDSNIIYNTNTKRQQEINHRLKEVESKLDCLRCYLRDNIKIEKGAIRNIFAWQDETENVSEQKMILKELSFKVKGLIKENHELRCNSSQEQIQKLRKQNSQLQRLIQQLSESESKREKVIQEENQYLRNYIEKIKMPKQDKRQIAEQLSNSKQFTKTPNNQSLEQVKRFFINYINEIANQTDEKNQKQQKIIDKLAIKIDRLQRMEKQLEHLKFQRQVKIQETIRKSKVIINAPFSISGDHDEFESSSNPANKQLQKRIEQLQDKNTELLDQLENLRDKYTVQIENNIRQSSTRQDIQTTKLKLQNENRELKKSINQMNTLSSINQKQILELTLINEKLNEENKTLKNTLKLVEDSKISSNIVEDYPSQVRSIRQNLLSCNLSNFQKFNQEISTIINERNRLKQNLNDINRTELSKQDNLQKQLNFMIEKNIILQQKSDLYLKQLNICQNRLREIEEGNEQNLAKDISAEIRQISLGENQSDYECLSWQKVVHNCLLNSVSRLQNLQAQMKNKQSF